MWKARKLAPVILLRFIYILRSSREIALNEILAMPLLAGKWLPSEMPCSNQTFMGNFMVTSCAFRAHTGPQTIPLR